MKKKGWEKTKEGAYLRLCNHPCMSVRIVATPKRVKWYFNVGNEGIGLGEAATMLLAQAASLERVEKFMKEIQASWPGNSPR